MIQAGFWVQASFWWSLLLAAAGAGGLALAFGRSEPTTARIRGLLIGGLVSALAALVIMSGLIAPEALLVWPGPLALHAPLGLQVLAALLPAVLVIMAGLGFRRHWHTGPASFFAFGVLIFSALVYKAALASGTQPTLIVQSLYKGALFISLAHGTFSVWSGRQDDLDIVRRSARAPLAVLFAVTCMAILLLPPHAPIITALLLACWTGCTGAIILMQNRPASARPGHDEKLAALEHLLERRRIWREDDLNLERVGDRLLLENSDLRSLIFVGLGFRRFEDLLDHHRVGAARIILQDPDQIEMRLEEVAVSIGYRSLPLLEAAFMRLVGESVQGFRRRHLEKANANRPLQLTNTDR